MTQIACIGLGRMGHGIASRLLAAGHELSVFNRTASKARQLAHLGARIASSPADACKQAEVVIAMVSDDAASREVWIGKDGVFAASTLPRMAIECSTLSHDWVLELAAQATARGMRYVDSPVTGLPDAAAAGLLTLLVGATNADLVAARPVLEAFSNRIIHFGAVGAGTAYKLIINMLGAVQIASAAEALAIAEKAGLDLHVVVDAIGTSQAASPQVIRNTQRMLAGDHDRNVAFTAPLRVKDVAYCLALAKKFSVGSPFGTLAAETFREVIDAGFGDQNETKVIDIARQR